MPKSMTAFARRCDNDAPGELICELRSINHRFFEPTIRLPDDLRSLDPLIRERLGQRLERGKLDCTVRYTLQSGKVAPLQLNTALLDQLLAVTDTLAMRLDDPARPNVLELLRWPGLLIEPAPDMTGVQARALALLDLTLTDLLAAREREGSRLQAMIEQRCERLAALVDTVRERLPTCLANYRQQLHTRLAELRAELDPTRLEQEMLLFIHRTDVAEELDRLTSHLTELRSTLTATGAIGRRLDFLLQELNREANTLGSKSQDVVVTRAAVDMKVAIEQIREQVQNLE
ncbi:YicC family protein [Rhodoferax sp. 4810]|uniref:YicC family protein n=1 Tax=Thiospirillum jenense TaxID=1653858 RepID=A0A839H9U9_9GAMM|nr:YicC/YloC family endoribonuclease [Thiospirillum jenense]MBB1073515.1 YicC family protein [Rhodoferax jenense]MBB1126003.1 YicC family protein [Thiospirillum jenense]